MEDEVERESPLGIAELGIGLRPANFRNNFVRSKSAAERAGDDMLDQDVERRRHRHARFDRSFGGSFARSLTSFASPCINCESRSSSLRR